MKVDAIVTELKSDNNLLQLQLQDLEYMIQLREEELEYMRKAADAAVALQSRFQNNLHEIEQMQNHLGEGQRNEEGSTQRANHLEEELVQSIQTETAYLEIMDQYTSTKALLDGINSQLSEASVLYKQVADLNAKVAELQSNLDIALLDNQFLKEDLDGERGLGN
jgi:hypothetical protein